MDYEINMAFQLLSRESREAMTRKHGEYPQFTLDENKKLYRKIIELFNKAILSLVKFIADSIITIKAVIRNTEVQDTYRNEFGLPMKDAEGKPLQGDIVGYRSRLKGQLVEKTVDSVTSVAKRITDMYRGVKKPPKKK